MRRLEQGIQAVDSLRGNSSHEHNPFIVLKRPTADENQGEVMGFSLIYSGNFLAQAQVDTHDMTRVLLGIHPFGFFLEARSQRRVCNARGSDGIFQRRAWRDEPGVP